MPSRRMDVESRSRVSLLPGVILCVTVIAISGSVPAADKCPRTLDCAREGRHFCQSGSSHCGPCLAHLVEDEDGRCVGWRRRTHAAKVNTLPKLDEEIDFLSSIIAKQKVFQEAASPSPQVPKTKSEPPKQPSAPLGTKHPGNLKPTSTPLVLTQPVVQKEPLPVPYPSKDRLLIIIIAVCAIVGTVAIILAGVCWVRLQNGVHLSQKVDYPAFRVMGPHSFDSTLPGDKNLAQSAQMYHYQHQKQQMLSLERHRAEPKIPDSGTTTDEENEDGDFTVYECPGLAPTGEMEVRNPLFDDSTLHSQRNH